MSHRSKIIRQSFGYKLRGWVLGLANMEIDRTVGRVRRNFLEELVELLEWIGLQPIEIALKPSAVLRLQVTDPAGVQVPDVTVGL